VAFLSIVRCVASQALLISHMVMSRVECIVSRVVTVVLTPIMFPALLYAYFVQRHNEKTFYKEVAKAQSRNMQATENWL
jgi:hypothetical protein